MQVVISLYYILDYKNSRFCTLSRADLLAIKRREKRILNAGLHDLKKTFHKEKPDNDKNYLRCCKREDFETL